MVESNEIKKVAVDAFKGMSALNILKYQQGIAKFYRYTYTVPAGESVDVEINVPSGYIWIIRRFRIACGSNTSTTAPQIDGYDVLWGLGAGSDTYIDNYWGSPMEVLCRSSITFTFNNSGTADELGYVYLWVIEIPETALSE